MRVNHSKEIVAAARNDPNFLKSIITGDETWCFQYDPKTKRQSAEWKSKNSPHAKKTWKVPSKIKTMLITHTFFDSKRIVHRKFVPTNDISTIKTATTRVLEGIPQTQLEHTIESLLNRCNKCIEIGGEYFV